MTLQKLTLCCPATLGEQVTEFLLESEDMDGGFISFAARGHGRDLAAASLREKVRGHTETVVFLIVLPEARLRPLLESLRAIFPVPHMTWRIEPVIAFGDFA